MNTLSEFIDIALAASTDISVLKIQWCDERYTSLLSLSLSLYIYIYQFEAVSHLGLPLKLDNTCSILVKYLVNRK